MQVGIRELRDGLSRYLDRVKRGEIVEVTDRGRTVARIIPAGLPPGISELLAEGKATWSGRRPRAPKALVKLPAGRSATEFLIEDWP